jgi:hypothetical protein
MKRYTTIALAMGLAIAGCKDNPASPPTDAPTPESVKVLSRQTLQQLAIGVTATDRAAYATTTVLILAEIYARDIYRIDASEPRYVQETLGGNPDPGSFAGSGGFAVFYTAIRASNSILVALKSAPAGTFDAAETNAASGFFQTMKALDYYRLIEMRDTIGVPIQTLNEEELAPIRCKPAVLDHIAALLDSANADFAAAGATTKLPFTLPGGFSAFGRDYNVVSNLILFNRGLKGKVDFYRALNRQTPQPALFTNAVAELTQALEGAAAGAVPATQLSKGVYYRFDPVVDQFANPRVDSRVGVNPKIVDSVQAGDTRSTKIVNRSTLSGFGLTTTKTFFGSTSGATNQNRPISLLRDEELVLLRAQAYAELGQLDNARLDINSVRTTYGLAPILVLATKSDAIKAALYEKRFSFLFEGPQRLVDLRAYGFLNGTYFAKELPTDPFNSAFPIPRAELNARGGSVGACTP